MWEMIMVDFKNAHLKSAGAYVTIDGRYAFTIGWKLHHGNIPVVRLGGHANEGETGWECAVREVEEEAGIHIRPVEAGKTYLVLPEMPEFELRPEIEIQEVAWDPDGGPEGGPEGDGAPNPFLVVAAQPGGTAGGSRPVLSLMYLAESDEMPAPSAEVKGILLLDGESIREICESPVTLDEYLKRGGRAIFSGEFDRTRRLEPFLQLRILAQMLKAGWVKMP
jgi:hypothetical protein